MSDILARLGLAPETRAVIIEADELGMCHATNLGVFEAMRAGMATSASLLSVGPWAREAAARYRGEDIGVLLSATAPHELYRWGPITRSPSLLGGDGGFARTPADLWDHADTVELERELRSQIERAIMWGFDITHLADHLEAFCRRPELHDVLVGLAVDFALPLLLPDDSQLASAGFPARELTIEAGVLVPDRQLTLTGMAGTGRWEQALMSLAPGLTVIRLRPAQDTPEIRALDRHWANRIDDLALAVAADSQALLDRSGAVVTDWRRLRHLQRRG